MTLKELLGKDFKEDMTIEEINALLKDKEMVDKSTLPDLNDYVPKERYNKASSDAADWKKKYRSTLDEAEQLKLEREEAATKENEELENLRREVNVSKYEKQYLGMGYSADLAASTATALYDKDMDTVFKNQASFIESTKKEVAKTQLKQTPTPPGGNEGTQPTVKASDMSIDELQKLANDNPEEFAEITK